MRTFTQFFMAIRRSEPKVGKFFCFVCRALVKRRTARHNPRFIVGEHSECTQKIPSKWFNGRVPKGWRRKLLCSMAFSSFSGENSSKAAPYDCRVVLWTIMNIISNGISWSSSPPTATTMHPFFTILIRHRDLARFKSYSSIHKSEKVRAEPSLKYNFESTDSLGKRSRVTLNIQTCEME